MTEEKNLINIEPGELLKKVSEFHSSGYRLVQIGCTKTDVLEINYSFDKDFNFVNLKVTMPLIGAEIQSVSSIYWSAFLYENEMSDLYGIKINNMAIDYKGSFYRTTVKFPFNPPQEPL
ncbi:MAG: NADH-quinone oxidoreductase subunit C [Candidatus Omnitrophota bacterium]|nr:NADH-quinone oxidoreductase subunit C [Candidatus Omnitrophota bacterium]